MFALFLACGLAFQPLTSSPAMLNLFQALYYISSFFAQFVNATTFLLVSAARGGHAQHGPDDDLPQATKNSRAFFSGCTSYGSGLSYAV